MSRSRLLPLCLLAGTTLGAQEDPWSVQAYLATRETLVAPAQSSDPAHPGSSVYPYATFRTQDLKSADGKSIRVWIPQGATGPLPLICFGPGKSLGGLTNYQKLHEHLVKKGFVVAHIRFEGSFFDTDFVKFGRWFNNAVKKVLDTVPQADAMNITYAGHSLGSQVATIAAGLATGNDPQGLIPDPKALVLMAYDNSRGPNNGGDSNNPACGYAVQVGADVQTVILEFEDDTIAGPAKAHAEALYAKLPSTRKLWLRIRGKCFGSTHGLTADHNTPLTGGGAPLNIGGKAALNALDWNATWKFMAGVAGVLSGLHPEWEPYTLGASLLEGGTASDGTMLYHTLMARQD